MPRTIELDRSVVRSVLTLAALESWTEGTISPSRMMVAATSDLYCGPLSADYWREEEGDDTLPDYSYTECVDRVRDWAEQCLPDSIWVNEECGGETVDEPSENGSWYDPETGEAYWDRSDIPAEAEERIQWEPEEGWLEYSRRDIWASWFGRELAASL